MDYLLVAYGLFAMPAQVWHLAPLGLGGGAVEVLANGLLLALLSLCREEPAELLPRPSEHPTLTVGAEAPSLRPTEEQSRALGPRLFRAFGSREYYWRLGLVCGVFAVLNILAISAFDGIQRLTGPLASARAATDFALPVLPNLIGLACATAAHKALSRDEREAEKS